MKTGRLAAVLVGLCLAFARTAWANDAGATPAQQGPEVPDFSPPPVPEFMLRKPARPLTLEEMQSQADEAARRARAQSEKRPLPGKVPPLPGADGERSAKEAP